MKVKIGDKVYSSEVQPVMVILTDSDKKNISSMLQEADCYASFPDDFGTAEEMREWMKIEKP